MSNAYSPPPYSPHPNAPPIAPTASEVIFAPLPLRPRAVLENLDLAFKLFRQYWKPMLAWGALSNLVMLLSATMGMSLLVGPPFIIGPICCVLAAAVRGQNVGFRQCWSFSQPRIGNVLAMHLLSTLIAGAIVGVLCLGLFMLSSALSSFLSAASFWPSFIAILLVGVGLSVVLSLGLAWQGMVSMVCCMEDEHHGVSALKRAWTLLRGRWKAALGLLTILNLALMALWGVLYGVFALFAGLSSLGNAFSGRDNEWAIAGALGAILISSWMVFTLFLPIYYLAQALFYLDSRVRHEALDLEWNAHRTVEAAASSAPQHQPYANAPQSFFQTVEAPGAPQTTPPQASSWAPTPQAPFNMEPSQLASPYSPPTSTSPPPAAPVAAAPAPAASPFAAPSPFSAPSPFAAPPEIAPTSLGVGATPPANVSLQKPEPASPDANPQAPSSQAEDGADSWSGSSPFSPR